MCFPHRALWMLLVTSLAVTAEPARAQDPARAATNSSPPAAEQPLYSSSDTVRWATPREVVPPVFPKALLERGETGVVDLVLELRETGKVERILEASAPGGQAEFEAVVRAVIQEWRFNMPLAPDCKPYATVSKLRVWFEIKEGKPSISVSHREQPKSPSFKRVDVRNVRAVSARLASNYPRDAREDIVIADVFARMTVDPVTGKTLAVKVAGLVGNNILASRNGKLWTGEGDGMPLIGKDFITATVRGLSIAEHAPVAGETQPITVCRVVAFRLSGL